MTDESKRCPAPPPYLRRHAGQRALGGNAPGQLCRDVIDGFLISTVKRTTFEDEPLLSAFFPYEACVFAPSVLVVEAWTPLVVDRLHHPDNAQALHAKLVLRVAAGEFSRHPSDLARADDPEEDDPDGDDRDEDDPDASPDPFGMPLS